MRMAHSSPYQGWLGTWNGERRGRMGSLWIDLERRQVRFELLLFGGARKPPKCGRCRSSPCSL